jgi:hypothetical protein
MTAPLSGPSGPASSWRDQRMHVYEFKLHQRAASVCILAQVKARIDFAKRFQI